MLLGIERNHCSAVPRLKLNRASITPAQDIIFGVRGVCLRIWHFNMPPQERHEPPAACIAREESDHKDRPYRPPAGMIP
jgi:hypothetical protein